MAGPLVVIASHPHGVTVKKDTVIPLAFSVTPVGSVPSAPAPAVVVPAAPVVDANAIARVEVRVNGKLVATLTQAPFTYNLDPTGHSGEIYQVEVTAWDNSNRSTTALSSIKIS